MSGVRYGVRHETVYRYSAEVVHAHQLLHLAPRPSPFLQCIEQAVAIEPAPSLEVERIDPFGNPVTHLQIDRPHTALEVTSTATVHVLERPPVDSLASEPWEEVRIRLSYAAQAPEAAVFEASRYRYESPYVRIKKVFEAFGEDCFDAGQAILAGAEALMAKVHREIEYVPGATHIATPLMQVLERKAGVCQDHAHLMIACLRARGLAARYVSGYLRTYPPADSAALVGADASHAWVSVFCPPFGWIELDPTNNVRVDRDHIVLAWGRDFGDVSPLRGVIVGGGQHVVQARVTVTALDAAAA